MRVFRVTMGSTQWRLFLVVVSALFFYIVIYVSKSKPEEEDLQFIRAFESLENASNKFKRFVFFDLGANKGDSLANFFGLETTGGGGSFHRIIPASLIQNNAWIAHVYEANPFFDDRLEAVRQKIPSKHRVFMNKRTAAWTSDGEIDFYLDTFARQFDMLGSSVKREHKDAIRSNFTKISVKCHDIAAILKQYAPDDLVIMKIDIEGAEYDLFVDFIKKNVLHLIDFIALEFHPFINVFKTPEEVFDKIIESMNITKFNWI